LAAEKPGDSDATPDDDVTLAARHLGNVASDESAEFAESAETPIDVATAGTSVEYKENAVIAELPCVERKPADGSESSLDIPLQELVEDKRTDVCGGGLGDYISTIKMCETNGGEEIKLNGNLVDERREVPDSSCVPVSTTPPPPELSGLSAESSSA
jgi:hypothetical protein